MNARGVFITIEGGEGVGKSTNIDCLKDFLASKGVDVIVTREPGGTQLGEKIRTWLLQDQLEPIGSMAELLLIFAARAQHIHYVIEPALRAGKWIICDRFTDATYAYQCAGRGIPQDTVENLEKLVQNELRPDYTLILDLPVEIGMSRVRNRGIPDRFEQESHEFFLRVRENYLARARAGGDRYYIVDVGRPLPEVQSELIEIASRFLARESKKEYTS